MMLTLAVAETPARAHQQWRSTGRCPKKWRKTTIADPNAEARAVDLIRRVFGPDAKLDTRWCGDITYSAQRAVMCSDGRGTFGQGGVVLGRVRIIRGAPGRRGAGPAVGTGRVRG
ncbi:MAG: hypothetical protein ACRD0M_09810, partial [Acidimicrobiales bacterium]